MAFLRIFFHQARVDVVLAINDYGSIRRVGAKENHSIKVPRKYERFFERISSEKEELVEKLTHLVDHRRKCILFPL